MVWTNFSGGRDWAEHITAENVIRLAISMNGESALLFCIRNLFSVALAENLPPENYVSSIVNELGEP
jgi:hypothetical protein